MKKIAIIGGWASGMMCAATILESAQANTCHITIFEKNAVLGKKVALSGGGRSNITTGITDRATLLSKYVRGSELIKSSLGAFSPKKVREWFDSHGVLTKCEEDLRVFPVSDRGQDSVDVFLKVFDMHQRGIEIRYQTAISAVSLWSNGIFSLKDSNWGESEFDVVVITTGGNAYSHTGSSGDGYALAKMLGHSITPLGPSLSSLELDQEYFKELSGLSINGIIHSEDGKYEASGAILFTHFGISWPGTFAFSAKIAFEAVTKNENYDIRIAPLKDWNEELWNTTLERQLRENPAKLLRNVLDFLLPKRFVEMLAKHEKYPDISSLLEKKCWNVSKEERKHLSKLLSNWVAATVVSRRAWDEFVTAGGVESSEIHKETLESLKCPNLYFAWEVLNVDGVTGGFNLQAAWCTGNAVWKSITKKLR